jgi:DAPG hydrolase PhiG domain
MGFVEPGRFTDIHPQKRASAGVGGFNATTIVLMHQIRKKPSGQGYEMRSRFWFGHLIMTGMNIIGSDPSQFAHDMAVHCHVEMTHLGERLPAIFNEYKNDIWNQ